MVYKNKLIILILIVIVIVIVIAITFTNKNSIDKNNYDTFKGTEPVMPNFRVHDNTSVIRGDSSIRYNPSVTDNDLTYFENDTINQNNIIEDAYDVINMIDKIDYGKVKTGIDKCKEACNGVCYEGGYTGSATCFPFNDKSFDYGTIKGNPMFINGIQDNYRDSENYSYGCDIF
jgi:hypothetical protein